MKIYDMDRGTGKTSLMIQLSAIRGARIITSTEDQAKIIKAMVERTMYRDIPEPMSYERYMHEQGHIKEEILVDELDLLLQSFFPNKKIIAATRSSSEYPAEYYELNIQGDKL